MAKALFGHVGSDLKLVAEVRRLRARVAELESELALARASDAFAVSLTVEDDIRTLTLERSEPALT